MSSDGDSKWSLPTSWWDIFVLFAPGLEFLEHGYPRIFLTHIRSNFNIIGTHQQRVIFAIIFPLLSYYFYRIFVLKRTATSQSTADQDDQAGFLSLEEIESLAEQLENYDVNRSSTTSIGLTPDQVEVQRAKYGFNETWKPPQMRYWLRLIWDNVTGAHFLLLQALAVISLYLGYYFHTAGFLVVVLANVGQALYAQLQANDVCQSLLADAKMVNDTFRSGKLVSLPIRELVPGDIIHLKKGEALGAEARVICASSSIIMDQSAITGENKAVEKNQGDVCYSSTGCHDGDGYLCVSGTAYNTFIGRVLLLVDSGQQPPSPNAAFTSVFEEYRDLMKTLGMILSSMMVGSILLLAATTTISKHSQSLEDWTSFALNLLICITPPYLFSITRLLRSTSTTDFLKSSIICQSGIYWNFTAEVLAGIDTLVCDKTGTLTKNHLEIRKPIAIGCETEDLLCCAALAIPAKDANLDPIAKCVVRALETNRAAKSRWDDWEIVNHAPFSAETKTIHSVVKNSKGEKMTCLYGAPMVVLSLCSVSEKDAETYREKCRDLAQRGFRVLGVAQKSGPLDVRHATDHKETWQVLGLLPMFDPPRDDTSAAIKAARAMGVDVRMCTGDASVIAAEIGRLTGLRAGATACLSDIDDSSADNTPDNNVRAEIQNASVYSEVFPEQKLRIVKSLQEAGHRVAITGDGLSDAPSLRRADFGFAVEGSTETAQSAADAVMTQAGLATIVEGLRISRRVFQKLWVLVSGSVIITMHDICMQGLFLLINGRILSPWETMICFASGYGIAIAWSIYSNLDISTKPLRWDQTRLWRQVLPLTLLHVSGTLLVLLVIAYFSTAAGPVMGLSRYILSFLQTRTTTTYDNGTNLSAAESIFLLFVHVILSRRWLYTLLAVDWSTHLTSEPMVTLQIGVDVVFTLVFNPVAVACISVINLCVFMGSVALMRAQSDTTVEKSVDAPHKAVKA